METLKINYLNNHTELCEIGRKYDSNNQYTIFFHGLFKHKRFEVLNIAEIGISEGASLQIWKEYFPNANIYGFDNYNNLNDNAKFDVIIDNSKNQFPDRKKVKAFSDYLKPGGILIIKDICNENDYMNELKEELKEFQNYYFIELISEKGNSKLFVLTKSGAEPIFKNKNKITIITPSCRPYNLYRVKESINFDYVDEWIIVYDGGKISSNPELFKNNDKIREFVHYDNRSTAGNAQRNYALDRVQNKNTLLYYLDDDNQMHPNIYKLLDIIDNDKLYYFNQLRMKCTQSFKPYDNGSCDSAMFIIPFNICSDIRWILHEYCADSFYIVECYERNKNLRVNVDNYLCYHNII